MAIEELDRSAEKLDGTITYLTTYDHTGRTSKKIVIEYGVETKDKINS